MKVLVLSCATGGGHNAAGMGICNALEASGHQVDYRNDYLKLAGNNTEKIVCGLYVNSVKICPKAFNVVYKVGRAVSTWLHGNNHKSPVYYANRMMSGYIEKLLEGNEYDAIVMPHLFPAETITAMKKQGCRLPMTIAVGTDYSCIPFWEETDCDYYVVPHEDCVKDFVLRGIPSDKLVPIGIPAPSEYTPDAETALYRLPGVGDGSNILIMGGSMGAGRLPELINTLERKISKSNIENVNMIVVCGSNKKLYDRLKAKYRKDKHVTVLSYIKNVAAYMKQCDVLYTKPGGLTSTQSAIVRIPTIFMEPISDCEKANSEFFVRYRAALAPKGIDALASAGIWLLSSEERMYKMKKAQAKVINDNCGGEFVRWLEGKVNQNA